MISAYDLSELDDIDEVELADQLEQIEVLIPHDEEQITPQHYSIFIKYMKINEKFITEPEQCEKLVKRMVTELHTTGVKKSPSDWLIIMSEWREKIQRDYDEYRYKEKSIKFTAEELELVNLLTKDEKCGSPTQAQLSCMLDHLEIASASPKLWATINLEMESLGILNRGEHYWRKMYEKWCSRVKLKKQMLDNWNAENSFSEQKPSILSTLELRLIEFLTSRDEIQSPMDDNSEVQQAQIDILSNYCRVCLSITSEMIYIFSEMPEYGNIVEKINHCARISPIVKDDGFPQNICQTCIEMLDNAYRFKVLCEKSDSELHTISKEEFVKLETREYFDGDDAEIFDESNNCSEFELSENLSNDVVILAEAVDNYEDSFDKMEVLESSTNDYDETNDSSNSKESNISPDKAEEDNGKPHRRINKTVKTVRFDKTGTHQCETCGIFCDSSNGLRIHMKSHASLRPHRCSFCEKEFKTRLSLKIHIRSHTGERPYVCEVCSKTFSQNGSLVYHRQIHLGIKNFECGLCDFRARSQNDLNLHSRKHTGVRPYTCGECNQKFTTSSNLQKHMRRRHTGEKNFQTCGKAFKTCSAVNNHKAIHSGVKEFKCSLCPYQACTKANLKIHDRTHSGVQPYSCRFCVLKFSTASNMHKHIRNIHQKLKTHKCDQCHRSFFSRESARKHMVTHTKLKPYSCTHCPMAYGWYNGLQKHMKSLHPEAKMPTEKSFFVQMEKELEQQKAATDDNPDQVKIEG